ncbi:MAG: hypothetical protein ACLPUO_17655 [Streptosporangiaceae bacterium]|jgi:hypothetical protein
MSNLSDVPRVRSAPRLRRPWLAVPAAVALAAALAACSSSGSAASGSASAPVSSGAAAGGPGATFHGKIVFNGASKLVQTFTDHVTTVQNCADAAKSGTVPGVFKVPSPSAPGDPLIDIQVAGFHGYGTYSPAVMEKDKSDVIWVKNGQATNKYELTAHSATQMAGHTDGKEVLFLSSTGAGTLAFSSAHVNGQKTSPEISGEIAWSCTS